MDGVKEVFHEEKVGAGVERKRGFCGEVDVFGEDLQLGTGIDRDRWTIRPGFNGDDGPVGDDAAAGTREDGPPPLIG